MVAVSQHLEQRATILAIDEDAIYNRAMRAMLLYSENRLDESVRDLEWLVSREPEGIDLDPIRNLLQRIYLKEQER